jgi:hypothetical protein
MESFNYKKYIAGLMSMTFKNILNSILKLNIWDFVDIILANKVLKSWITFHFKNYKYMKYGKIIYKHLNLQIFKI